MTYVTLWSPAPIGAGPAGPLPGLLARLLALAPHVAAEPRGGGTLVWVDGRGLPARALARAVLRAAREAGVAGARVGVAAVPAAAEVAARRGLPGAPGGAPPEGSPPNGPPSGGGGPNGDAPGRGPPGARPCTAVAPGAERAFLAGHPVAALLGDAAAGAERRAAAALADAGVVTCGALAALTQAAVEVRTGAAGVALWRLARGEDRRVVFRHRAAERPSASVEWTEFELREPGPLVFAAGALVAQVCAALAGRGEAARALALAFALADGRRLVRPVRSGRDTADPAAWRRLVRAALERVGAERGAGGDGPLAAGVVGLALTVEAARRADAPQADLFDRGSASALAAERAAARLVESEWGQVVRPRVLAHAVPERRVAWEPVDPDAAVRAMAPAAEGAARDAAGRGAPAARPAPAAGPGPGPGPAPNVALVPDGDGPDHAGADAGAATAPPRLTLVRAAAAPNATAVGAAPPAGRAGALRLRLLAEPRPLAVTERQARGHRVPARYRERTPDHAPAPTPGPAVAVDGTPPAPTARRAAARPAGRPLVEVLTAAGPDRVAAGHADGAPVARDYWHCLTDQGALVLLYRAAPDAGAPEGRWFLHGWWD